MPVRLVLHAVFWWLLVVGIVQPARPRLFYEIALVSTLVAGAAVAAWPNARRRIGAFLHRWLPTADLITVNLFFVIVFAELGVRALGAVVDSPLLVPEDATAAERIRHHRYPPNGQHNDRPCNSLGLVDEEFELARTPGVRRIVALGDSFAVSVVRYADNFLTIVDEKLDAQRETEVLNFGVSSTGLAEYLHMWRTEAKYFEPDVVLLCFFIGNDFERHWRRSYLRFRWLRSVAFVRRLWLQRLYDPGSAEEHSLADLDAPTFPREEYLRIETRQLEISRLEPTQSVRKRYQQTFALLAELHDEIGDRLRVIAIPDEYQVDDDLYRTIAHGHESSFDVRLPNRRLADFLEDHGVPFLDLTDTIRRAQATGPTYKPSDGHWNARGNAAAAESIVAWLRSVPG